MLKVLVIGGPRSGKSTLSAQLAANNKLVHYCTDPKSLVKDVQPNTIYLPEGLKWGEDSEFVAKNWFTKNERMIIEGVGVVRALRKWNEYHPNQMPCSQIIRFKNKYPTVETSAGQDSMHKSILTIWESIAPVYTKITFEL